MMKRSLRLYLWSALAALGLLGCGSDAPDLEPAVEVEANPAERRAARRALEADFSSLTTPEARATLEAEDARNRALEQQSGGQAAAVRTECVQLRLELAELARVSEEAGRNPTVSAADLAVLPREIADRQQRLRSLCGD